MSPEIEDGDSTTTVIFGAPFSVETLIEQDGLTVLVQDQSSSSVVVQQESLCEIVLENQKGNSVCILDQPSESLIIDLNLSTSSPASAPKTGWAQYSDTQYTASSPFEIDNGQFVALPNNAGSKIETYLPPDIVALYDPLTRKILPKSVGDYNTITVRFKAVATTSTTNLDFGIDIGGTQGILFRDVKVFPRGAGVEHSFSISCPGFSLNTFVANGGWVMLGAVGGDVMIYNIEFQIVRIHGT